MKKRRRKFSQIVSGPGHGPPGGYLTLPYLLPGRLQSHRITIPLVFRPPGGKVRYGNSFWTRKVLLHTIRAPATELDIQVKATDEETEAQTFPDFSGPGPGPSRGVTLPYLTTFLGSYN